MKLKKVRENKEHKSALSLAKNQSCVIYSRSLLVGQFEVIVGAFVHKAAFDPVLIQSV